MSKVLITEAYLEDIAAALRNKSGGVVLIPLQKWQVQF